ncbi:thermostable hemolysin [Kitasatospora sp. NPDC057965]|uniref:thermostable hemolysin n=1 Tax=Kitasatospora sp. NPDC057965 TaxID=3346291 RepID=UPI0036DF4EE2
MRILLSERGSKWWMESAKLVQKVYSDSFGANVEVNPEFFLSYLEKDSESGAEEVLACTGITVAGADPLFLETYLDVPVESLISSHRQVPVNRGEIIQLGSVASVRATAGAELFKALAVVLWSRGCRYAVMTSTQRSLALQRRLGIIFNPVGEADPGRLDPEELKNWGTFYDQKPLVVYAVIADQTSSFVNGVGRYHFNSIDMKLIPSRRELAGV